MKFCASWLPHCAPRESGSPPAEHAGKAGGVVGVGWHRGADRVQGRGVVGRLGHPVLAHPISPAARARHRHSSRSRVSGRRPGSTPQWSSTASTGRHGRRGRGPGRGGGSCAQLEGGAASSEHLSPLRLGHGPAGCMRMMLDATAGAGMKLAAGTSESVRLRRPNAPPPSQAPPAGGEAIRAATSRWKQETARREDGRSKRCPSRARSGVGEVAGRRWSSGGEAGRV